MEEHTHTIDKIRKVIRVGTGEFDLIGINRIKRKHSKAEETVVMVPGSNMNFATSFENMATCLAMHNIDVWGIDFRYSPVPDLVDSTPYCKGASCDFMKDWNTNIHISDLDIIVKMAEVCSNNRVFLIGYSQGAYFTYKYATNPNQLKGIIPIDVVYNLDPTLTDVVAKTQEEVDTRNSKFNSGIYYEDATNLKFIANQALTNPDGPSQIIPGLTNKQASYFVLTETYKINVNPIPNFRYATGDLTKLNHIDFDYVTQQTFKLNNFQPMLPIIELRTQWLETSPSIPDINVPILHIASEFGFGTYGFYTPEKIALSNPNVEMYNVPDYGHIDLIYSSTAKMDVWKRIYNWIIGKR